MGGHGALVVGVLQEARDAVAQVHRDPVHLKWQFA